MLVGHMIGSAFIFSVLMVLAWSVWGLMAFLNSIHEFPSEVLWIIKRIEVALVWFDLLLCAVVQIAATVKFVREIV
jgi:Na+-transporting methylmalonyl-CoA/oxaloacetate decarboxylase gamma subunit